MATKKPKGPKGPLRVVRPGDDRAVPEEPPRRPALEDLDPPRPLKIKGFVAAPPGWFAWFAFSLEEYKGTTRHAPIPVAGFATVEGELVDRVVPMVFYPERARDLIDPRELRNLLRISQPPETLQYGYRRANTEYKRFTEWYNHRVGDENSPRRCECSNHDSNLCRYAQHWVHEGLSALGGCECLCHHHAGGTLKASDEEFAANVALYGPPPVGQPRR